MKEKVDGWSKKGMEIEGEVMEVLMEGVRKGWVEGFRRVSFDSYSFPSVFFSGELMN